MWTSLPLAAGGGDVVITIIFGLISFGAWIINTVKKSQEEQARRNAGAKRPRDQKVRREIEEFLQQQKTGRPSRPAPESVDVEVVDEPPVRNRPSPVVQPRKTPKQNRKSAPSAPKAEQAKSVQSQLPPRTTVGHLSQASLGAELREHVHATMAERVTAQAERDLPHLKSSVAEQVQEDLGEFTVSKKASTSKSTSTSLIRMLVSPQTARQAVLISEIMGRPKALRK